MINFESIGLFGTNRHFLSIVKEWWNENIDRFKNWNVMLDPMRNTLDFVHFYSPFRNFTVFLLKDDYACVQGRRFDIIVNPPDHLKKECHYRLISSMHSFISYQSIFDILTFVLERNNELDCLDYQALKNKEPGVHSVPFVPVKEAFKTKPEDLVFELANRACGYGIGDTYNTLIKDLLNLEFGRSGIKMDIRNKIEDVIFNGPATIIKWTDDTKTVVKCQEGDADPWVGMAMAISKKVLGNKGNFNEVFKKWIKEEPKEIETDIPDKRCCASCLHNNAVATVEPCMSCNVYDNWEANISAKL